MAGFSIVIDDATVNALLEGMSGFELLELANIAGPELYKLSMDAFEKKKDPVTGKSWKPSKTNPDTLRKALDPNRKAQLGTLRGAAILLASRQRQGIRTDSPGGRPGRARAQGRPFRSAGIWARRMAGCRNYSRCPK